MNTTLFRSIWFRDSLKVIRLNVPGIINQWVGPNPFYPTMQGRNIIKKVAHILFTSMLWCGLSDSSNAQLITAERRTESVLLTISGETNRSYTLIFSSDLVTWRDALHIFGKTNLLRRADGRGFYTLKTYPPLSRSPRKLYVNVNAGPQSAIVISEVFPSPLPDIPSMVVGDKIAISFYLVDGEGSFDVSSGAVGGGLTLVIGEVAQPAYTKTTNFTPIPNGWQAVLDLSTPALRANLAGRDWAEFIFQLEFSNIETGETRTLVAQPVQIYNKLN